MQILKNFIKEIFLHKNYMFGTGGGLSQLCSDRYLCVKEFIAKIKIEGFPFFKHNFIKSSFTSYN